MLLLENIGHVVGTYAFLNLFYSPPYPESVSCFGLYPIPWVESCVPYLWSLNLTGYSPCFNHVTPTQVIDGTDIAIDFMDPSLMQFNDDFNVTAGSPAHWIHAGAFEE